MIGFFIFSICLGVNIWSAALAVRKRRWSDATLNGFLALHFSILSGAQWLTMGGVE